MLEISKLKAAYDALPVLFGVDLSLSDGECLALIGANGAGKSTTFACLTGLLSPTGGEIRFGGEPISGRSPQAVLAGGIAMVPEGRRLFPSLTVEENLKVGAYLGRKGPWTRERVYATLPMLANLRRRPSTALSGGQQQLVAVGRALMGNPSLLLCDEISLGLSPAAVDDVYEGLASVQAEGVAMILVEQDIARALGESDRFACMRHGRIVLAGESQSADRAEISDAYFGVHDHA